MTDPLNDLKAALRAQTPDPDSTRRAQTLARAQEMFDHAQGSAAHARPMNIPPRLGARFVKGMFGMFNTFTRPVALTATTALVAGVFFVSAPLMRDLLKPSSGFGDLSMEETAVSEPASPRMARAP